MNKKVCVLIPIYKPKINKYEKLSIDLTEKKLSCFDIFFVTYKQLDLRNYKDYKNISVMYFPKRYFKNTISYSRLLLKEGFYKKFLDYTYMLIVQTDALILGDAKQLDSFIKKHFDYWGARWAKPVEIHSVEIEKGLKKRILERYPNALVKRVFNNPRYCLVGNGGLSLRNIRKTIHLIRDKKIYAAIWFGNEDKFFAYYGLENNVNYHIAPANMVDRFSLESFIKQSFNQIKPFGVHAWVTKGKKQVLCYLNKMGYYEYN